MIFRGRQLFDFNVGLVLAGGGAKGAYQAGVIRALWDLDLIDNVKVVSGVSIGTLNALCLCMKDRDLIEKGWKSLSYSKIMTKGEGIKISEIGELIKNFTLHKGQSMTDNIDFSTLGVISQKGIRDYIQQFVDVSVLNDISTHVYSCVYNVTEGYPQYFRLNNYSKEEIIDITVASCAVPYLFPPVSFKGKQYADGGINNPLYPKPNADNVPIYPLMKHDCDLIIVVHLNYSDKIDRKLYPQSNIIEIYPSASLELINGSGTINFNQYAIIEKIQMGYRDALVALTPMLMAHLKGKSMMPYIKNHYRWNEQFLKKTKK